MCDVCSMGRLLAMPTVPYAIMCTTHVHTYVLYPHTTPTSAFMYLKCVTMCLCGVPIRSHDCTPRESQWLILCIEHMHGQHSYVCRYEGYPLYSPNFTDDNDYCCKERVRDEALALLYLWGAHMAVWLVGNGVVRPTYTPP